MSGFFTRKEVESISRPGGKTISCSSCGLYNNATNPRMEPYGEFKKKIMIIGENPTEADDARGKPWQGRVGRFLQKTLSGLGVDLFEDCISLYAVNCATDKIPSNNQLDCCRIRVNKAIEKYKPNIIILFGIPAVYSVIGGRWKKDLGKINKWRGFVIPDQDLKAWVCPTLIPVNVLNDDSGVLQTIWEQDLAEAISKVDIPIPENNIPRINVITDLSILKQIPGTRVAFDFETTGLKPHARGHRIVCASVAISPDNVFVFMLPKERQDRIPFLRLLENPMIEKIAHNMKFEDTWANVRLQQPVENWYWDTMVAAHIADNRPGICSLQFQVYVNFGVADFKSETDSYLGSVESKNGNAFNRIEELVSTKQGRDMLLERNAMDSIWEYRLAQKQMDLMDMDLPF